MSLKAQHYEDRSAFARDLKPGSFWLGPPNQRDVFQLWYRCPCGCGIVAPITVGKGFKPQDTGATWTWNGSVDTPTLHPSVNHVGHWHGWLQDGIWTEVGS